MEWIVAMSWSVAGSFWFARLPDRGYFELIYVTVGIRIGGLFCQSPKFRKTKQERRQRQRRQQQQEGRIRMKIDRLNKSQDNRGEKKKKYK